MNFATSARSLARRALNCSMIQLRSRWRIYATSG
jgi:hypothetical protein